MQISGAFCLMLALMLLVAPLPWVVACIFAAAFHELCHYFAIRIFSGIAAKVQLLSYAAHMELPAMSRGREVICALAGPVGSLSLLLLAKWMPRVAVCGAMQALYNLIPVYPLDGGRALQSGLALLLPPKPANRIYCILELLFLVLVFVMAIYSCIWLHLGLFPLLLAVLLCIRLK